MQILISLILFFFYSSNSSVLADRCINGDCFGGYGTYVWTEGVPAGDKYVGESVNNDMHGLGTYYFNTGEKYIADCQKTFYFYKGVDMGSNDFMQLKLIEADEAKCFQNAQEDNKIMLDVSFGHKIFLLNLTHVI